MKRNFCANEWHFSIIIASINEARVKRGKREREREKKVHFAILNINNDLMGGKNVHGY